MNDNASPRAACFVDRHVAARLRALRMARGLSQKDLADAVGTTFQQIQKYESAANRISAGRLYRFAAILDVPVERLFEGIVIEGQK